MVQPDPYLFQVREEVGCFVGAEVPELPQGIVDRGRSPEDGAGSEAGAWVGFWRLPVARRRPGWWGELLSWLEALEPPAGSGEPLLECRLWVDLAVRAKWAASPSSRMAALRSSLRPRCSATRLACCATSVVSGCLFPSGRSIPLPRGAGISEADVQRDVAAELDAGRICGSGFGTRWWWCSRAARTASRVRSDCVHSSRVYSLSEGRPGGGAVVLRSLHAGSGSCGRRPNGEAALRVVRGS